MDNATRGEITQLLQAVRDGNSAAVDELFGKVYQDLRRIAAGFIRNERAGHTLQPTALVHEAYLRLYDARVLGELENRAMFFSVACRAMREILVDSARMRGRKKRGGGWRRSVLDDAIAAFEADNVDLDSLDAAMKKLEVLSSRQHRMVDLRYFGGFSIGDIADLMQVSASTVERDLRYARAFLHGEMQA